MPTVVLIEDDTSLRTLFSEWLSASGHRVCRRSDLAAGDAADVNLVVVDLRHLSTAAGGAVAQLRNAYPNARLVGMSTQVTRTMPEASPLAIALGVKALLPKPCTQHELLAAVSAALHAGDR